MTALRRSALGRVSTWSEGVPETCRVLKAAVDYENRKVLGTGALVTVERRAERGQMKVCDLAGASLVFAMASTSVEVLREEDALQALADHYRKGTWRVIPAGQGYPDGDRYAVETIARPGHCEARGTALEIRNWLGNAAMQAEAQQAACEEDRDNRERAMRKQFARVFANVDEAADALETLAELEKGRGRQAAPLRAERERLLSACREYLEAVSEAAAQKEAADRAATQAACPEGSR